MLERRIDNDSKRFGLGTSKNEMSHNSMGNGGKVHEGKLEEEDQEFGFGH